MCQLLKTPSPLCLTMYLLKFHTKQDFVFKYHPAILFTMLINGSFKSWEFYRSHPFAENKQSIHIFSFLPGAHAHVVLRGARNNIMVFVVLEVPKQSSLITFKLQNLDTLSHFISLILRGNLCSFPITASPEPPYLWGKICPLSGDRYPLV